MTTIRKDSVSGTSCIEPIGGPVRTPSRILVVDDEAEVANLLVRSLRYAGYQAESETDSMTALERCSCGNFDLTLIDLQMPRLRGDEMLTRLRQQYPDIAVILVTAAVGTDIAVSCLKAGAYDYIVKPFDLYDVTARVAKALERRATEIELRMYQSDLQRKVGLQASRIRSMVLQSMESLTAALEAKDENTREHSARVAHYAIRLAEQLPGTDDDFTYRLRIAALLHDIGKIGIHESILNKGADLEPYEYEEIRRHPVLGETILKPLFPDDPILLSIVRHHHERWDGQGYPDGFVGEHTPVGARILSIVDAFDAMISVRPYRTGMTGEEAMNVIRDGAGTQWDPTLVAIFDRMLKTDDYG